MKKEDMAAVQNGYYCSDCCKVVVDFSTMSNGQIEKYFQERSGQKTCGIFSNEQLNRKPDFSFDFVRFAAAVLLVFGGLLFQSCKDDKPTHTIGDSIYISPDARREIDSIAKADSLHFADSLAHAALPNDTVGQAVHQSVK